MHTLRDYDSNQWGWAIVRYSRRNATDHHHRALNYADGE